MSLPAAELAQLIESAEEVFAREPQLLRKGGGAFLVVGDTHGDADTSVEALRLAEREGFTPLFLGDYVDRGAKQVENIALLLESKLSWGDRLVMLRGNHETAEMNLWYGFYQVVSRRYGSGFYERFAALFSKLPYAALLPEGVLCLHGGLAEGLGRVEEIEGLPKGEVNPENPIALQLLWNDPSEDIGWFAPSWRGGGAKLFGRKAFKRFMEANKLRLMLRAHEPQDEGYGYLFEKRLLTVFSCRYYGVRPAAALVRDGVVEEIIHLG